jgi:hypothetical protein
MPVSQAGQRTPQYPIRFGQCHCLLFSDLIAHHTPSYRCRTANYIQFTENAFNVSLDRAFGDKEFCANLFVRFSPIN